MDAVGANSPADHVHQVTRFSGFCVTRAAVGKRRRHQTNRAAVHQRLADVAVVEHDGAVDRRDARFVAAHTHAGMDATQHAARVEEVGGEVALPIRWAEAEHIGVRDGASAQTGPEDVAVDAHDARHCSAVGVKRRGGIVGLCLHADAPRVVPGNHP